MNYQSVQMNVSEGEYTDLLKSWKEVWEPEHYNKNMKMLSLGVLFGGETAVAKEIRELLDGAKISDWLLCFLLSSWIGDEAAGAVAKILRLDDTGMEHTLYYPYDLVHYK